jgi:15-cis-phytoene desaturase
MTKVAILGGGVGGMSAAHELAERGFEVEVYEKMPHYVGGKARSILVPNSGTDGRKDLPGGAWISVFPRVLQAHYAYHEADSLSGE